MAGTAPAGVPGPGSLAVQVREQPSYAALRDVRDAFLTDTSAAVEDLKSSLGRVLGDADVASDSSSNAGAVRTAFLNFLRIFAGDTSSAVAFAAPPTASQGVKPAEDGLLQGYILQAYATGARRARDMLTPGLRFGPTAKTRVTARRDSPEVKAFLRQAFSRMSEGSKLRFGTDLDKLRDHILSGLSAGKSAASVLQEAKGDLDRYEAYVLRRIVNTETAFAATHGSLDEWDLAGIKSVVFRTGGYACRVCQTHAGNVIPMDEAKPGVNVPPIHPHCYCYIQAVLPEKTPVVEPKVPSRPRSAKEALAEVERISQEVSEELANIDDEKRTLRGQWWDANTQAKKDALNKKMTALSDRQSVVTEGRRRRIWEAMLPEENITLTPNPNVIGDQTNPKEGKVSDVLLQRATKGFEEFTRMIAPRRSKAKGLETCGVREVQRRAFFQARAGSPPYIAIDQTNDIPVVVHELGHWLEFVDYRTQKAAKAFLAKRTKGETAQTLRSLVGKNYDLSEVAKPDKFFNPYCGKIYPQGDTEIVSMGLEKMFRDPSGLALDEEYFTLIWNVMHNFPAPTKLDEGGRWWDLFNPYHDKHGRFTNKPATPAAAAPQPQTAERGPVHPDIVRAKGKKPEKVSRDPRPVDSLGRPLSEPERIKEILGKKLHVEDENSRLVQAHLTELGQLHPALADRLAKAGVNIYIGEKPFTKLDDNEHLSGVKPRGHTEGSTWDKTAGGYEKSSKKVTIAGGFHGSASAALHELGHAVGDHMWDEGYVHLDVGPQMKAHHARLFNKLSPYLQQDGPGGHAGMEETFAEGFAHFHVHGKESTVNKYDHEYANWIEEVAHAQRGWG